MVKNILSKYVRSAAEQTCTRPEFASLTGLAKIMKQHVAHAVMRLFEERHFKAIRERWTSTIELYKGFFPLDASVRTMMFAMHSPLHDMLQAAEPHKTPNDVKDDVRLKQRRTTAVRARVLPVATVPDRAGRGGRVSPRANDGSGRAAEINAGDVIDRILSALESCKTNRLLDTVDTHVTDLLPTLPRESLAGARFAWLICLLRCALRPSGPAYRSSPRSHRQQRGGSVAAEGH